MIVLLFVGLGAGAGLGALIGYWGRRSAKVSGLTLNPYRKRTGVNRPNPRTNFPHRRGRNH
jgi:hypothetical protein